MPFLIVCAIFKCFDIMGLFYCVYLGVSCVAVFVMFSMKADRINKEYAEKEDSNDGV